MKVWSQNIESIKIYSTKKSPVNKLRAEFLRELNGTFIPLILPAVYCVQYLSSMINRRNIFFVCVYVFDLGIFKFFFSWAIGL